MGTVTQTIGTGAGRTYTTIAAFFAGLPANLVTDGNSYIGTCFNDSEFTAGAGTIPNITTDSTHTVTLTTGAGQSFQDNASIRTTALSYNQTNGVGINPTATYATLFNLGSTSCPDLTISKLQIKNTKTTDTIFNNSNASSPNMVMKDCFIDSVSTGGITFNGGTLANIVILLRTATAGSGLFAAFGNVLFIGCSAIRASNYTAGGVAFLESSTSPILQSCCCFGFTTTTSGTWSASSKNNATDQASITGSSNQTSVTYNSTTPFTGASDAGTLDLRAVASTALAANGFLDSTNAPNDISATARANPPTIGHWELVAAATQAQTTRMAMCRVGM